MNAPRVSVSVIIPSFNRAELLPRALDSVLAQTRPVDEIIVIDDGSDDATSELIPAHYPQVRYLRQANTGVAAARNRGIQTARGEWLAFLDSDDAWLPQKIEHQLIAIERYPDSVLIHGDEIWIRHGKRVNAMKKHAKTGGWIYRRCLPLCVISPSATIIHRAIFASVGLFDESLPVCEDYDLWLRITARCPVHFLDEPLIVKYGGHEDQLSRRYWGMDRFRVRALEKMLAANLNAPEHQATLEALVDKLGILESGARKRGKHTEAQAYAAKRAHYTEQLSGVPA